MALYKSVYYYYYSPSSKIGSSPLKGSGGNCRHGGKSWQPTAGFMTHVTCRLTAKSRDQLRNPTLGNQVWATFTFTLCQFPTCQCRVYLRQNARGMWGSTPRYHFGGDQLSLPPPCLMPPSRAHTAKIITILCSSTGAE